MSPPVPARLLLGPQRPVANLGDALARSGISGGSIGVISAAWQEGEAETDDLQQLVQRPLIDLHLYRRADELFRTDEGLHKAYRARQERLKEQQRLYRMRLRQLMIAARATLRTEGTPAALEAERRHAISQLRALDKHHLRQVDKVNNRFADTINVESSRHLADVTAAVKEQLSGLETVLITGGNVVVLMNRLQLFGLDRLLREKNLVGWSAGAMVLCERIVLFHEKLPQGRRDAEIMCPGMGILPGIVALPDATGRLRVRDPLRISLFERRFSPAACITLDSGAELLFRGETLSASVAAKRITRSGKLERVRAA